MSNIIIVTIGGANASDELDTDRHSNAADMDNHAVTDDRDTLIVRTAIISFDKYKNVLVNQPDLPLCPLFFQSISTTCQFQDTYGNSFQNQQGQLINYIIYELLDDVDSTGETSQLPRPNYPVFPLFSQW